MKAYKGFDKDLKCRGFQYEVGKEYVSDSAKLCESGFHACEHPLDVFAYYPPAKSRFAEVDIDATDETQDDDSKRVGKKITIKAELNLQGIIQAAVDFVFAQSDKKKETKHATGIRGAASATGIRGAASATGEHGAASATGDRGAASATGIRGAASATGIRGAASATGEHGAASATGCQGAASATGDRGAASATGYQGAASATGEHGAASATGDRGAASATGYQGAASATGDRGAASATGEHGAASATGYQGIAISCGIEGMAKASRGNWIVVSEWKEIDGKYQRINVKSALVDGKKIKADTWYKLKDGKFICAT